VLASSRIQAQAKGAVNIIPEVPGDFAGRKRKAPAGKAPAGKPPAGAPAGGGGAAAAAEGAPGARFPVLPEALEAGPFELAADGLDEVRAVGQRLAASRCRADRDLAGAILGDVVPLLDGRQEAAEKLARARQRVAKALGLGFGGAGGGGGGADAAGRSRRARAAVASYAMDDYDKHMAVRGPGAGGGAGGAAFGSLPWATCLHPRGCPPAPLALHSLQQQAAQLLTPAAACPPPRTPPPRPQALIRSQERGAGSGGGSDSNQAAAPPRGLPAYTEEQLAALRRGRSGRDGSGDECPDAALDIAALERETRKKRRLEAGGGGGEAGAGAPPARPQPDGQDEKENSGGASGGEGASGGGKDGGLRGLTCNGSTTDLQRAGAGATA
jgi:hypothetical protein